MKAIRLHDLSIIRSLEIVGDEAAETAEDLLQVSSMLDERRQSTSFRAWKLWGTKVRFLPDFSPTLVPSFSRSKKRKRDREREKEREREREREREGEGEINK